MTDALSPLQRYQNDLKAGTLLADPAQASVIEQLDDLHARLLARVARQHTIWSRTQRLLRRSEGPERGLYLWGGVGRGKTHLVDTFFDSLPIERKLRVHFHRFMQRVHAALTRYSGAKNPLEVVAQDIADDAVVLCFDEFS